MTDSAITIHKPTETYGIFWPFQVWIDGRRAGTIGRYDASGTFRVGPGVHAVSVTTARVIKSEPRHLTIPPDSVAQLSMRRLAGARVPLKILLTFSVALTVVGPGSRWASGMLLPESTGFWAPLALSLLVGLAAVAACLGLTLLVLPRYWVWWSLTSEVVGPAGTAPPADLVVGG